MGRVPQGSAPAQRVQRRHPPRYQTLVRLTELRRHGVARFNAS